MSYRNSVSSRSRRVSRDQSARSFPDESSLMEAWRAYKASGAQGARNRLAEHYLFLVRFIAERISAKLPGEVDVDDLMSAGIFGLVDAIDTFDLERGVKFETFGAPRIRGAILDELRSMDWVPRLVRHRAQRLEARGGALEAQLGRQPSEEELARAMNLTRDEYDKVRGDANTISLISLSQAVHDSESNRELAEVDVIEDENGRDPVIEAQKADMREIIEKQLTPAERLILILYYYEQMTMKEIGATLDLSESRVSQMHTAMIERMQGQLAEAPALLAQGTDIFA